MKIEQLNKSKIPIVRIDKSLEKLKGKNLFPEKLAEANEVLSKVRLPKTQRTQPTNETAKAKLFWLNNLSLQPFRRFCLSLYQMKIHICLQ